MLFLGLGTGLGSTLIVDGIVEPMELGHLPYKKGTYESHVGNEALVKQGKKKWRRHVADVVARLIAALEPDQAGTQSAGRWSQTQVGRECRIWPYPGPGPQLDQNSLELETHSSLLRFWEHTFLDHNDISGSSESPP